MYNFKRDWQKRQYTDWLNSGGLPDYNVETLHLSNNNDITNLSDNINNLPNLKEINLSRTPITQLPSSIGQLNNLEELYLQNSGIESLPEELKTITRPIKIVAYGTPLSRNPNSGLQNWPPNFYIFSKSALDQTMLLSIQQLTQRYPRQQQQQKTSLQINLDTRPNDYIGLNEYSVNEFLQQGYKIFIKGNVYYAVKPEDELFAQINDNRNEFYICNRSANGVFKRTNVNPLFSINIITGFQGFVSKEHLKMALNSQDNYFEITEKGDNIAVIKGHPNSGVFSICEEANAKIYEIKIVEPIISNSSSSSSNQNNTNNKYSFLQNLNKRHSDIFKGKGGRKRRTVKRKTRRVKRTRRR
jgi:Leucine-rich repeat (LRR) protein